MQMSVGNIPISFIKKTLREWDKSGKKFTDITLRNNAYIKLIGKAERERNEVDAMLYRFERVKDLERIINEVKEKRLKLKKYELGNLQRLQNDCLCICFVKATSLNGFHPGKILDCLVENMKFFHKFRKILKKCKKDNNVIKNYFDLSAFSCAKMYGFTDPKKISSFLDINMTYFLFEFGMFAVSSPIYKCIKNGKESFKKEEGIKVLLKLLYTIIADINKLDNPDKILNQIISKSPEFVLFYCDAFFNIKEYYFPYVGTSEENSIEFVQIGVDYYMKYLKKNYFAGLQGFQMIQTKETVRKKALVTFYHMINFFHIAAQFEEMKKYLKLMKSFFKYGKENEVQIFMYNFYQSQFYLGMKQFSQGMEYLKLIEKTPKPKSKLLRDCIPQEEIDKRYTIAIQIKSQIGIDYIVEEMGKKGDLPDTIKMMYSHLQSMKKSCCSNPNCQGCKKREQQRKNNEEFSQKLKSRKEKQILCHFCETQEPFGEKYKTCGRCKKVYYCSRECQKKDWKNHKKNCHP